MGNLKIGKFELKERVFIIEKEGDTFKLSSPRSNFFDYEGSEDDVIKRINELINNTIASMKSNNATKLKLVATWE
jgi:hypothetical protein